jgi:glyoxylate/hydroxypyruvate reductase
MAASAVSRIVVTRRLPASVLNVLRARPATSVIVHDSDEPMPAEALREAVSKDGGAHALICLLSDKVDRALLESARGSLRAVATMSVGYNHVDVSTCRELGVRVGYTPGVLTEATADLVLALTLATCRRIVEASRAVVTGEWSSWKPFWMTGKDLANARVGIIGMGRIGEAVARRLKGFNCDVTYTGRSGPKPDMDAALGARWVDLNTLLAESDVVIAVCALTSETRGMLTYDALKRMKEDGVFVNASRGEVVDQDGLVRLLRERPRMRAGLDVTTPEPLPTDSPLLSLPNAVVLPHIGSASEGCRMAMAEMTVQNVLAGLDGADMPAEVPETQALRKAAGAGGGGSGAGAGAGAQ